MVYGFEAMVYILCHLMFIYLTFWALQSLRLEKCFKKGYDKQIRILYLLLSIAIGFTVSSFFLQVMQLFKNFVFTFVK